MLEKKSFTINRQKLFEEIWNISLSKVAKKYDLPYDKLKQACKTYNVPLPTASYWGDKCVGKKTIIPDLPDSKYVEVIVNYSRRSDIFIPDQKETPKETKKEESVEKAPQELETKEEKVCQLFSSDGLDFLDESTRQLLLSTASQITIGSERKLHKTILKHKTDYNIWKKDHPRDEYANWKDRSWRFNIPPGEPVFWESVSEKSLSRVYLILDAIFKAVEFLGGKVNEDFSLVIRNESVHFSVTETKVQVPHVMTKKEQEDWDNYEKGRIKGWYAYRPKIRKYDYVANGKIRISISEGKMFKDWDKRLLETQLGDILLELYRASEVEHINREKREEEHRRKEEERRQRELVIQMIENEKKQTEALKNKAEDYAIACSIRNYVAALEAKDNISEQESEYIKWANEKADWYDPTVAYDDPLLGKREHDKSKEEKENLLLRKNYHWW